jgi:gliding motility-associated-like protein
MKRIFTILTFTIFGAGFLYPQVYDIQTYNGQTVNTCTGTFASSATVTANTYYTITFCSNIAGDRVSVDLSNTVIAVNDSLWVYDGPNTSSPMMHKYPYAPANMKIGYPTVSSGSCLTFRFITHNATSQSTWSGVISCIPIPAAPNACNGNPPASNYCKDAPLICNLNDYCGNTSSYYTADLPGNLCEECNLFQGTLQNNSWLKLIADTSFVRFQVSVSNCSNGQGVQIGIYQASDCDNFKLISDPNLTFNVTNANSTFRVRVPFDSNNVFLTKGQQVYIMVDGLGGDVCDYKVKALVGALMADAGPDRSICRGESVQLNGKGGNTYSWSPAVSLDNPKISNPIATPDVTTTYTCTFTGGGSFFCPQTATDIVVVHVKTSPDANFTAEPKTVSIFDPIVTFTDVSTGLPVSWQWTLGDGASADEQSIIHTYSEPGRYLVTLRVTNQNGCTDSIIDYITVENNYTIFIPNAFKPEEGINNIFYVYGLGIYNVNMKIFDRWGEKIFESDDISIGWDGTYKGNIAPQGTYVYRVSFTDSYGEERYKLGSVTLLR